MPSNFCLAFPLGEPSPVVAGLIPEGVAEAGQTTQLTPMLAPKRGSTFLNWQSGEVGGHLPKLSHETKNPENAGVSATFSGFQENSKGGTRTRDTRLMKPVL